MTTSTVPGDASRPPPLPALTGLRFVAALVVLLFHTAPANLRAIPLLGRVIERGYVGVSCFFVLSGFILAYNYLGYASGSVDKASFWWARLVRVYPLYILALLVSLPHFLYAARRDPGAWADARLALTLFTAPTLTQAWFPNRAACAWNCPGWSLSAEAFFYLCFPFAGGLIGRARPRALLASVALAGVAAVLPVLYMAQRGGTSASGAVTPALVVYFPPLRLSEFVLGIALGVMFSRQSRSGAPRAGWGAGAAASGAAIVGVLVLGAPGFEPFLHTGGLAILFGSLVYCLAGTRGATVGLGTTTGVLLGEASYALYVLHVPLAQWWRTLSRTLLSPLEALAGAAGWSGAGRGAAGPGVMLGDSVAGWLLYCVFTIAVSMAAFRYVEDPARRYLRRWAPQSARSRTPAERRGDEVPAP